ncbi:exo-alpha-sialidase [Paucibacter sp. R3-3]|uniref:Exo-alpha-sialidase n=1 Tax=Roseateles agri TaxID=3098619 RepID=A0ABU5DJK0_9BURK|nr:exo-alpha-sialidase [Paucibacter sp. R3-3]MDY0746467.1 exo-alpha-sialidase [Paucibacter sp. R3-3]
MSTTAWAATRKGLFELRHDGANWQIANISFLAEPVSMVLPAAPGGRMLAALNLGHFGTKLHASDDGGQSWTEVAAPAYPPQPEGAEGPAWKLQQVWSLERGPGDAIWAGTIPGGLFRSDDGGASWQLNEALWNRPERLEWFGGGYDAPGIHSICPHPSESDEMLLGISCGGAWRTTDGAAHWELRAAGMNADFMPPERQGDQNIQDPHLIARCAGTPEVLWTQHHCGIWRSTDNGASWHECKAQPASFGFAVAAHPQDGDTAWFAPAVKDERRVPVDGALCVTRTRDGGRSFEQLRRGLPQQHCYDLVYRHGLVVDDSGQRLLMGSTTGNLWASDNAGDDWVPVALNLPPIYALKFA